MLHIDCDYCKPACFEHEPYCPLHREDIGGCVVLVGGGFKSAASLLWAYLSGRLDCVLFVHSEQLNWKAERNAASSMAKYLGAPFVETYVKHEINTSLNNLDIPSNEAGNYRDFATGYDHNSVTYLRVPMMLMQASQLALDRGIDGVICGLCKGTGRREHSEVTLDLVNYLVKHAVPSHAPKVKVHCPFLQYKHVMPYKWLLKFGYGRGILKHAVDCHNDQWACGDCDGCAQRYRVIREVKRIAWHDKEA